mmetsp:Transcript_6456/g.10202  ORF Transcript_6456/g.10202 Transcript_6456/m.10202 type:complete len:125 (-) Transcript_6456:155-529(-)
MKHVQDRIVCLTTTRCRHNAHFAMDMGRVPTRSVLVPLDSPVMDVANCNVQMIVMVMGSACKSRRARYVVNVTTDLKAMIVVYIRAQTTAQTEERVTRQPVFVIVNRPKKLDEHFPCLTVCALF